MNARELIILLGLLCLTACVPASANSSMDVLAPTLTAVTSMQTSTPTALPTLSPTMLPTSTPEIIPSCGERMDLLSIRLVDTANLNGIVPLGNISPPGHVLPSDHIYMHLLKSIPGDWNSAPIEVPVYSPSEIFVMEIAWQDHLYLNPPYTDYDLFFVVCEEVEFRLAHLTSLSPALLAVMDEADNCMENNAGQQERRFCWKRFTPQEAPRIPAGEQIATVGGNLGHNALNLFAYDRRKPPLTFVAQNPFWEDYLYTACPLDYFVEPIQDELIALLGRHTGSPRRTIAPLCGQIDFDVAGTARGVWFSEESRQFEDPHLSLVYDNIDPTQGVLSIGISFGESLPPKKYLFEPHNDGRVNRRFEQVTVDGEVYCYENFRDASSTRTVGRIFLLQLLDDTHLRTEALMQPACGAGPWEFSENALDFSR